MIKPVSFWIFSPYRLHQQALKEGNLVAVLRRSLLRSHPHLRRLPMHPRVLYAREKIISESSVKVPESPFDAGTLANRLFTGTFRISCDGEGYFLNLV